MGRTARVRQRCRATEHISSAATVTWGCERHGGHRVDGSSLCVSRRSGRIRIFGREAVAGARVGCRLMERRRRARRQRRSQAASHGTVTSCAEEAAGMGAGASIGKESGDGYLDRARRSSFFFPSRTEVGRTSESRPFDGCVCTVEIQFYCQVLSFISSGDGDGDD
jgi:hypothetical protein